MWNPRTRSVCAVSALIAAMGATFAAGANSGGWYVAPDFTLTNLDSDVFDGSESNLGISFGKRLGFGRDVEFSYGEQRLEFIGLPDRARRHEILLGGRWAIDPIETPNLYLSGGVGAAYIKYLGDSTFAPTAFAGLGYKVPVSTRVDFLAEGRLRYSRIDDAPGQDDVTDSQAVLKLRYNFTPTPASTDAITNHDAAPAASTVYEAPRASQVSLREQCRSFSRGSDGYRRYACEAFEDDDGDGVPDSKDICQSTIPGVTVDADGCMTNRRPAL
jgi:hypothetical protein